FAWRQRSILRRSSSVRWLYFDPMTQSSCLITYWFQTEVALGNSAHRVMNFVRPGGGSGPVWLGHAHLILFRLTAYISK
ncbi:MAG: hypothetical protein NXH99_22445, partial [Rhodobacteraceae bacterium]|nr:hypothetical protein [Paracoccaceae bacterium]